MDQSKSLENFFGVKAEKHREYVQSAPDNGEHPDGECPVCKLKHRKEADICERCGTWLLTGQCCFCYQPFQPDQKFCTHCGNPPKGVTCGHCGKHSYFDICPHCNTELSRRAKNSLGIIEGSPEIQLLKKIIVHAPGLPADKRPGNASLDELTRYLEVFNRKNPIGDNTFVNQFGDNKDFSAELANLKSQEDKSGTTSGANNDLLIEEKVRALQSKMFDDNQAARLFYTQIKILLPQFKRCSSYLGWQCRFSGAVHFDGPSGCAGPAQGGRWICQDEVEWVSTDSFILENETYAPGPETPRASQPNS